MSDFITSIKRRTMQELAGRVNAELPPGLRLQMNPAAEEEDEEDDDALFDIELPDGVSSMAFEGTDAEKNLACAAGVYRIVGIHGLVVAQHKSGDAFCGTLADFGDYTRNNDTKFDDYKMLYDPKEILEIDPDPVAMGQALSLISAEPDYASAEDFFKKFHWGDNSRVSVVREIPGVTGTLVHLGVGRRIEYGAQKDGEWAEYYHLFGEKSDEFPNLYAVMSPDEKQPVALVIHGGKFRIEGRGLVE